VCKIHCVLRKVRHLHLISQKRVFGTRYLGFLGEFLTLLEQAKKRRLLTRLPEIEFQSSRRQPVPLFFIFSLALQLSASYGLLVHEVSLSHTMMRHNRLDSSGRVISSSQRPLPDKTQHTQQTNIHATGGIQTHDLSRRAAVDLRL
jgi:hypothetical protein